MSWWKKLFTTLTKPGLMPEKIKQGLEAEGLHFFAERIRVAIIYRNFKAPGRRYGYKHAGAMGSLGITSKRIAGFAFSKEIVHLPFTEPAFKSMKFEANKEKYLAISFDASTFNPQHSGKMEIRFYLPNPQDVAVYLRSI